MRKMILGFPVAIMLMAASAQAQGAVWSATFTPGDINGYAFGCRNGDDDAECSNKDVLSDDTFTVGEIVYTVTEFYQTSGTNRLYFAGIRTPEDGTSWVDIADELKIGSTSLDIGDAFLSQGQNNTSAWRLRWSGDPGLDDVLGGDSLTDGTSISVTLISGDLPPPPPPPTTPGAPTGLAATANGPSQIDLAWTAPASTGGSAITGYKIEVSPDGSSWSDLVADTGSTDTAYAHMGLDPATTRHYRVSAINAVGTSNASDSDDTTTASTNTAPTGAPTITGTAQVGADAETLTAVTTNSASCRWADGLTSPTYTYQWIRVDGTEADIARREFEHLHPGRRRPGQDPQGQGDLRRRPRPYRDAHQRGDGDGGRGSDGPDGERCGGHVNAGLGHHLLPRGRGHRIHRDVQRPGDGDRHTEVRVQAGRGDAAGRLRERLGQRGVGVRPDGAGRRGRSQRHLVECARARPRRRDHHADGRDDGREPDPRRAGAAGGHRVDAAPPMQVSASVHGLSLVLVYDEPLDPASMPATGAYTVTATVGATTTNPAVSEVSIYGIWVTLALDAAPAAGATVTLAYAPPASNPVQDEAGNDAPAFSGQSVRLGPPPPPDLEQVMGVGVAPGNAQLVVTWTAVDNATGYTVQWTSGGQGYNTTNRQATVTSGSTTSHTITGLANGTEYTVQVSATRTGANDGPPSDEMTGTPTVPTAAGITVSTAALTVTEQDSTGDGYTVVLDTEPTADVVVTVAGHVGTDVTANPTTLTFTMSNWETAQTVTVTADDDADTTDDSVALTHSAASADSGYSGIAIAGVAVTVNDNDTAQVMGVGVVPGNAQLVVTWTAVDNATGYTVQWTSGGQGYNSGDRQATVTSGSTTSHTITGLANGTEYTVQVSATRTGANDGPPSDEMMGTPFTTPPPPPPPVTDLAQVLGVHGHTGQRAAGGDLDGSGQRHGLHGAVDVGRPGLQQRRPAGHGHFGVDHESHDHGPRQRHRIHGAGERDPDRRQRRPALGRRDDGDALHHAAAAAAAGDGPCAGAGGVGRPGQRAAGGDLDGSGQRHGLHGAVDVGQPGLQQRRPAGHGHVGVDHESHDLAQVPQRAWW